MTVKAGLCLLLLCFASYVCVQLPALHSVVSSSCILCGLPLDVLFSLRPKSTVFRKWTFFIWQVHPDKWSSLQFLLAVKASFVSILSLVHFGFEEVLSINFKQLLVATDNVFFCLFEGPKQDSEHGGIASVAKYSVGHSVHAHMKLRIFLGLVL